MASFVFQIGVVLVLVGSKSSLLMASAPDTNQDLALGGEESTMPGVLLVALLAAAVITLIACPIILALYRRLIAQMIALEKPSVQASPNAATFISSAPTSEELGAPPLLLTARCRVRRLILVYSAAGFACTGVLTSAFFMGTSTHSHTAALIFLIIFSWPILLSADQIAVWDSRTRRRHYVIYAVALVSLWLVNAGFSPGHDHRGIIFAFLLVNAIPTFLILCFTSYAVRTIGPCIFSMVFIFVLGGWTSVHAVTKNPRAVFLVSKWTAALGTSPEGAVTLLMLLSFAVFLVIGFAGMTLLIGGYARNWFSDQSIRLDSFWLVIALSEAIFSPGSIGSGLLLGSISFAAYWLVRALGLRWVREHRNRELDANFGLLYLRRFGLRGRTERLFRTTSLLWRPVGDVVLIGGPDLARSTIQPHSLLQFLLRRTKEFLITSHDLMEAQIARLPSAKDIDARSRVTEFLCTNQTWQQTVSKLMDRSEKVIADFRGLVPDNSGSLYEIEQMACRVAIERMLIITDGANAKDLIVKKLAECWTQLPSCSPNCYRKPEEVKILVLGDSEQQTAIFLNYLFSMPAESKIGYKAASNAN